MNRYFKEVEELDNGKISLREFVEQKVGFINPDLWQIMAVYRIYLEDGGKRYAYEDFLSEFGLEEDEESKQVRNNFMKEKAL